MIVLQLMMGLQLAPRKAGLEGKPFS